MWTKLFTQKLNKTGNIFTPSGKMYLFTADLKFKFTITNYHCREVQKKHFSDRVQLNNCTYIFLKILWKLNFDLPLILVYNTTALCSVTLRNIFRFGIYFVLFRTGATVCTVWSCGILFVKQILYLEPCTFVWKLSRD